MVVGVDGSAGASEALRWALAEGRLRNSPVRAVHAWTFGYVGGSVGDYPYYGGSLGLYTSLGVDLNDVQRAGEELLAQAITSLGDQAADGVEIERHVVEGNAATVLLSAATPIDLLVVGSRGHGGFATLLLGSISQQCVHHATCPVVVVHPPKPTPTDDQTHAAAESQEPASA